MNIALEKTDEYVNGVKRRSYGDAFVRGNNGKPLAHFSSPLPQSADSLTLLHSGSVMYISAD
jgi:hypothetical protein